MKETHYKLKHRVTALFAAVVMLCSMLPGAAFAEEPTPQPTEETVQMEQQTEPSETDNGQTDASSPDPGEDVTEATPETAEEQPAEEEISAAVVGAELYTDLPDAPIGSYIGSEGLPVATGETKIGISEWPESQLEETSGSYLTAVALDNDGLTMAAPLLDGADYQDEQERLRYLSKSTGLNQEQVLRKVLMDAPLLERPTADYIKMSRQIAALGNNLNQLAHIANASGKVSNTDLLTAKQIMEQIWRYIKGGGVQ